MKKFLSILLAAMMLFAMVGTAFADDAPASTTYTITINGAPADHTFEAYQIFTGTYSAGVLSDIVWGSGVNSASLGDAEAKAETLKPSADTTDAQKDSMARAFATEIAPSLSTTYTPSAYDATTGTYTITVSEPGYYLIKDADDSLNGDNDAYTRYMIQVLGNATVSTKASKPTVEKKVKDANDSTDDEDTVNGWFDSADHDVGDLVEYQVTGTLPSTLSDYSSYYYAFHDTMSAGLTFKQDTMKVEIIRDDELHLDITAHAVVTDEAVTGSGAYAGGKTYHVVFNDLMAICSDLKSTDTIVWTYKCELDEDAKLGSAGNPNKVYLEYDNNPNAEGAGDTGNTIEDVNIVFTYSVIVNKVDIDKNSVAGAEFSLFKLVGENWVELDLEVNSDETIFTASGLDDGYYKLVEDEAPDGYNKLKEDIYFRVTADHQLEADNPALSNLEAKQIDGDSYADLTTGILATFSKTATSDLSTDIVNQSGVTLPSTGGIGTTLFYLFGSIMAAGSALILVVRRRAEAEEE